jgi:hypothetical protein
MAKTDTKPAPQSPWQVLGLAPGATETEIRAAYAALVRECSVQTPSERSEELRRAFDALRDPVDRACHELEALAPEGALDKVIEHSKFQRRFVGPDLWLAIIKEK